MMRRSMKGLGFVAALAALALAAAGALMSQTADDPLDPVRVAGDTHKVALDNTFVRVLDVRLRPGRWSPATAIRTA